MAPKRPMENTPSASSSEEEDEEKLAEGNSDTDGEDHNEDAPLSNEREEKEQDEESTPLKKPTAGPSVPSDPESDSDSEESLPSPKASGFTVKPIRSKPITKPTKSVSKSGSKRAVESESTGTESKKAKKAAFGGGEEEEAKKGSGNQRLWSEDDEIAVFKGISEFRSKTGTDPNADMGAFHDFIKKSIHIHISKAQLMDKIRRLKKKYQINVGRGENGQDPVFSKPHEYKCFQLSKKIWGSGDVSDSVVKNNTNGTKKKARHSSGNDNNGKVNNETSTKLITLGLPRQDRGKKQHLVVSGDEISDAEAKGVEASDEEGEPHEGDFWSHFPLFRESLDNEKWSPLTDFSKSLLGERLGRDLAQEMEKKWKKLLQAEMELRIKRLELVKEQAQLVLDALKSSS